jgi:hypothetical protein
LTTMSVHQHARRAFGRPYTVERHFARAAN